MIDSDAYIRLIQQLDALVAAFETHPDKATRERVFVLLEGLDALHREGLERLVERLSEAGSGPALEQAKADPIVKTLLGLYGLAELDLPPDEAARSPAGFIPLNQVGVLDNPTQS